MQDIKIAAALLPKLIQRQQIYKIIILKILCISPRFAPVNAADSHRLRLLLPYLADQGCDVEILAVSADDVSGPQDSWLSSQLPKSLKIHWVNAPNLAIWGMNGLAQRSFVSMYRKGCDLLACGDFDLIFFSTTEFLLHGLGPLWQRKFGVPFCMDFQDPWVNDYYRQNPKVVPPGGRFKYAVIDKLHRFAERAVVQRCSGFLSVSSAYIPLLEQRYGSSVAYQPRMVAGFPAEPTEIAVCAPQKIPIPKSLGCKTWRYIGRGGDDMTKAAQSFFQSWNHAVKIEVINAEDVQFETIGTSYAAAARSVKSFEPLVAGTTIHKQVSETPARLGYSDMLNCLMASDALIVFGSDDPAYTASKIYPYLLSGKPLLAIFHEKSSVVSLMHAVGGGVCITFNEKTSPDELAHDVFQGWFYLNQFNRVVPLDMLAFEPYTARVQAKDISCWFGEVIIHAC